MSAAKQSEELVMSLLEEFEGAPQKIWESNIFGKSLHELVNEGLHNKLYRLPADARIRMQETIERDDQRRMQRTHLHHPVKEDRKKDPDGSFFGFAAARRTNLLLMTVILLTHQSKRLLGFG